MSLEISDFSVRIVTCDSYMTRPILGFDPMYSENRRLPTERVSIIRIFGSTPSGETVCAHIHRVFPYLYVPYDGSTPVEGYLQNFARSMDEALRAHMAQLSGQDKPSEDDYMKQHVYRVKLVRGKPFYGYYHYDHTWLKIYFFNPQSVKSAVKVLLNGKVMGKIFQPYEAHIPYTLQFFMDYNLQGMNYLSASKWSFRNRVTPEASYERSVLNGQHHNGSGTTGCGNLPRELLNRLPKTTICQLEVDIVADDILNRVEIENKIGVNPGLEAIWSEENHRRALRGLPALVGLPCSQDRPTKTATKSEQFYRRKLERKLVDVSGNLDPSEDVRGAIADIVDNVDVMRRENLVFGVSDATVVDEKVEVQNSFILDRTQNDLRATRGAAHVAVVEPLPETSDEDDLEAVLADLAAEVEAEKNLDESTERQRVAEIDEQDDVEMGHSVFDDGYPPADAPPQDKALDHRSSEDKVADIEDVVSVSPGSRNQDGLEEVQGSSASEASDKTLIFSDPSLGSPLDASTPIQTAKRRRHEGLLKRHKPPEFFDEDALSPKNPLPSQNGKLTLTPAVRFPTWEEVCNSAPMFDLSIHVPHGSYMSSVQALARERLKVPRSKARRGPNNMPYRTLEEFCSKCIHFDSSELFQEGIKHVEGSYKGLRKEVKLLPHDRIYVKKKKKKRRKLLSDNVSDFDDWEPVGESWPVILTPALKFPDLSAFAQLQERVAEAEKAGDVDGNLSIVAARKNPGFNDFLVGALQLKEGTKAVPVIVQRAELKVAHDSENIVVMNLELQADVGDVYSADPRYHPIRFIAITLMTDTGETVFDNHCTCIYVDADCYVPERRKLLERDVNRFTSWILPRVKVKYLSFDFVSSEEELLHLVAHKVRSFDPDILIGYEIQMSSWGYLIERGNFYGIDMIKMLSRLLKPPGFFSKRRVPNAVASWESRKMSEIHIIGRIVLNVWRLIRHEVNLNIYTFENVVYNVLKCRLFLYSDETLTRWLQQNVGSEKRWRAMEYLIIRSTLTAALMGKFDIIKQTSEFSRLFGIQFYDTLTRGSQFRVESMMLRLAKPLNFIPVSPSGEQLRQMLAPESLPLILEPESRFYYDPVVVLDFQSLYPSTIIAYNYCFSTCLGRVESLGKDDYFKFGCTAYHVPPYLLKRHLEDINFSPNGVAFVKENVRKGILPVMLEEILNTRVMVKKSMGDYKGDPLLTKQLHARQLGLKLIANVTYGYTSASFSGRMPCIEIADSIVSKARETLERAIKYVESQKKWNAKVVYGDTDSMFVLLKGRSKDEAFLIGREIEQAITDQNPKPMKLKFEKVYLPCLLQTKKRYCGYMYESEEQEEPVFDAKGIETVRRDGCELVSRTLEEVIRMLFTANVDYAAVRTVVETRFEDVLSGNVNIRELIFAKEYRGREGYRPNARVPALQIARNATKVDPRAEPRAGERVPYIIAYGHPKEILLNLVRQPYEIFENPSVRPHGYYYCSRQLVPVLNRVLLLVGVDAKNWFFDVVERVLRNGSHLPIESISADLVFFRKFCSQALLIRGNPLLNDHTRRLKDDYSRCVMFLKRTDDLRRQSHVLKQMCKACTGSRDDVIECVSFDCPVLYQHRQVLDRLCRMLLFNEVFQQKP